MRVITANVNGIRSAAKKGFFDWLAQQNADLVCVQETKAQLAQLDDIAFFPRGYHCFLSRRRKKRLQRGGAVQPPLPGSSQLRAGLGTPRRRGPLVGGTFRCTQRGVAVSALGFVRRTTPAVQISADGRATGVFQKLRRSKREYLICGDWNIAHREIDLKNWRGNRNHSGFLPAERAWLDNLFDKVGYVDAFRAVNPDAEQYTWWSNRGQAWAKNVGWRIDYQIATPKLGKTARAAAIYKDRRFSDHAPLTLDYDFAG